MTAYYNENDFAAAHVLRCLIEDGIIAPGIVDDRSIKEVTANDLKGFTQAHFFAGAGTWSVAARLAGWPDAKPLWTASCPCQPYSAAGKGLGDDDPRNLWPDLFRIVRDAQAQGFGPDFLVGEQVAGKAGYGWFDGVRTDLAQEGYACGVRDFPALSVDAPHERNRLYWCAVAQSDEFDRRAGAGGEDWPETGDVSAQSMDLADAMRDRNRATPECDDRSQKAPERNDGNSSRTGIRAFEHNGRNGSFWSDAQWIECHDGKARRTKPGLCLLAHGVAGRIHLWRLAGNSIVAEQAAEVLRALLEAEAMTRTA